MWVMSTIDESIFVDDEASVVMSAGDHSFEQVQARFLIR
jgi:hypothetical protein